MTQLITPFFHRKSQWTAYQKPAPRFIYFRQETRGRKPKRRLTEAVSKSPRQVRFQVGWPKIPQPSLWTRPHPTGRDPQICPHEHPLFFGPSRPDARQQPPLPLLSPWSEPLLNAWSLRIALHPLPVGQVDATARPPWAASASWLPPPPHQL